MAYEYEVANLPAEVLEIRFQDHVGCNWNVTCDYGPALRAMVEPYLKALDEQACHIEAAEWLRDQSARIAFNLFMDSIGYIAGRVVDACDFHHEMSTLFAAQVQRGLTLTFFDKTKHSPELAFNVEEFRRAIELKFSDDVKALRSRQTKLKKQHRLSLRAERSAPWNLLIAAKNLLRRRECVTYQRLACEYDTTEAQIRKILKEADITWRDFKRIAYDSSAPLAQRHALRLVKDTA